MMKIKQVNSSLKLQFPSKKFFSSKIEKIFDKSKLYEYREKGYTILPRVFSPDHIEELKAEVASLIENANETELNSHFDTEHKKDDQYFLESGDKIRYFMEKDRFDENGKLKYPIKQSINKLGHALHDLNKKFERLSYSTEITYICNMLGLKSPIIVQSMYIFKSGFVGGAVEPHTDNTFIHTKPMSCQGVWMAFDDANESNGAMYAVPGSHRTPTDYYMNRGVNADGLANTIFNKDPPAYNLEGAELLPAEKGSIVLLHGDLVHFSQENTSPEQRHAYTMHIVESRDTTWEQTNWLQRKDVPFRLLYDNQQMLK